MLSTLCVHICACMDLRSTNNFIGFLWYLLGQSLKDSGMRMGFGGSVIDGGGCAYGKEERGEERAVSFFSEIG